MSFKKLSMRASLLVTSLLLTPMVALADYSILPPPSRSAVLDDVHSLHIYVMWVCLVIFLVVFGIMGYSLMKFRRSQGAKPSGHNESTLIEIIWTVIPLLILLAVLWPATQLVLTQKDTSNSEITIKVTGYQWKWQYDYLQEGFAFMSNMATTPEEIANQSPKNEHYLLDVDAAMVVPVNTKVRILTASNDVIHAWWVPELGIKIDTIPGFIRESWFEANAEGVFRGQCARLCGKDHAFMPIVVDVRSKDDYNAWLQVRREEAKAAAALAGQTLSMDELMSLGEEVYNTSCVACHQANGQGVPGAFPALAGSPMATTGTIADHIDIILNGKSGTAMGAYRNQLSDTETAAVTTYERNAWGNDTGDLVQGADVAALR